MSKSLLLFSLLILPAFMLAQTSPAVSDTIPETECGVVFTEAQQMPALTVPIQRFADTLTAALQARNAVPASGKITYAFVVTSQSQLLNLTVASGRIANETVLRGTVQQLARLWAPARQSGRAVCAHSRLRLTFKASTVAVLPGK